MTNEYARHLADLHARFEAPAELIAAAAREVTASPILARQRIVHGEANEVYHLAFASGLEAILRIARRDAGAEPLELCFLEKLPGRRLSDSLSLPRETLRSVAREIGEHLSRIHTIGRDDLGDGARCFEADTDDTLATEPEFVRLGVAAGLDRRMLERAMRFIERMLARREPDADRLTHNDLRACHVLIDEGRLSGLIDFGQVSIDTPVNDLAKWDYWEAPALPVAWLQEGYGDKSLFGEDYAERLQAYRITNALWVLRWYAITGYAAGVQRAAARIRAYVGDLDLA